MSKRLLTTLILIAFTLLVNVGLWRGGRAQALNVKVHVKDLPESGLSIIGPSDPAFDELMTTARIKPAKKELLKPFSVFIKNTGDRAVVAYKLRWECVKADGSTVYKEVAKSSAWVFLDDAAGQPISADPTIIQAHSTWLHSLVSPPQPLEGGAGQGGGWVTVADTNASATQELLQNPSQAKAINLLNAELAAYTSITIHIDGAFFDNGTFVGPDATGFFNLVKAQVDAKHDLLQAVKDDFERGKPVEEVLRSVEEIADGEPVDLGRAETAEDYYNYFKKNYAKEMVADKISSSSSKVIEKSMRQLNKPWAKLRKM